MILFWRTAMKKIAPKTRALEFIDEYWVKSNVSDELSDLVSPEITHLGGIFGKSRYGFNAFKAMRKDYGQCFSVIEAKLLQMDESESVSHSTWEISVKHTGFYELDPSSCQTEDQASIVVPPTNEKITYYSELIIFFFGQKISKHLSLVDTDSFLHELGLFRRREKYQDQGLIHDNKFLIMKKLKERFGADLTDRELECLALNLRGFSAKQSGCILSISQRTVESHLSHGFGKLNCFNKYQCFEMMYSNYTLPIWLDLSHLILDQYQASF